MIFNRLIKFDLVFDSPEIDSRPVFKSGDVVKGKVVLEFAKESKVKSLKLHAEGFAQVYWIDSKKGNANEPYLQNYADERKYLNLKEVLLQADHGELITIAAGRHEYPFSFQLPEETLMTSFEAENGSIHYWIKVKLHRPWSITRKLKKTFAVIEEIDINTPSLLAPQTGDKEQIVRAWFHNFGQISLNAKIYRKGYIAGEVIPIFAEFNNSSSRSVVPKACITQTQTFFARGTIKQKQEVLVTLYGDVMEAQQRKMWHGYAIKIPPVTPSILHCPILKVEYALMVCMDVLGTSKLSVELPLVLGTIPLHFLRSQNSSISSQYSLNPEFLRMAIPEQPESPPDYSSIVNDDMAVPNPVTVGFEEDPYRELKRPLMAYVQEFRFRPPPVYSDIRGCVALERLRTSGDRPKCSTPYHEAPLHDILNGIPSELDTTVS